MAKENVQKEKDVVEIPEEKIIEVSEIEQKVMETKVPFSKKAKKVFSKDNLKKVGKTVGLVAVGGVLGVAALVLGARKSDEAQEYIYEELPEDEGLVDISDEMEEEYNS